MNNTAEATWWDLIDTVKITIKDWTLNWCKDSYCIK